MTRAVWGLEPGDEEEFERIYLPYDQAECREEHLPLNTWEYRTVWDAGGASAQEDGPLWWPERPAPTEGSPVVLEAKRSVDFETVFDEATQQDVKQVKTLGDWEPPLVVAEWQESEWRYAAVSGLPVPDDGLPDNDWAHGQTEVMLGVIWLLEKPEPSEPQPVVVEVWRSVERYKNGKIKSLGSWSEPAPAAEEDERPDGDEGTAGDEASAEAS